MRLLVDSNLLLPKYSSMQPPYVLEYQEVIKWRIWSTSFQELIRWWKLIIMTPSIFLGGRGRMLEIALIWFIFCHLIVRNHAFSSNCYPSPTPTILEQKHWEPHHFSARTVIHKGIRWPYLIQPNLNCTVANYQTPPFCFYCRWAVPHSLMSYDNPFSGVSMRATAETFMTAKYIIMKYLCADLCYNTLGVTIVNLCPNPYWWHFGILKK